MEHQSTGVEVSSERRLSKDSDSESTMSILTILYHFKQENL